MKAKKYKMAKHILSDSKIVYIKRGQDIKVLTSIFKFEPN
ncbi:hypothetical protein HMPREF3189_00680 [Clostridiales bacterium KA00134]|nr:hypothetical protein HMPREF3189_00680 [Clostridiales bacterium KA00134]